MKITFIAITPSRFKGIVVLWTILGLIFTAGFLYGAYLTIHDLVEANFKFKSFPFFLIASFVLCLVAPLVFVLYYYSLFTLKSQAIAILRSLFIISIPLVLYFWITTLPSMRAVDIVYEGVFLALHFTVFVKCPGYFKYIEDQKKINY
jgi:hypothetical protein